MIIIKLLFVVCFSRNVSRSCVPMVLSDQKEKCQSISSKLLNDMYVVQLQLTPISDRHIPGSYLGDLSEERRREPGTWFDPQGAPIDYFTMYVKEVNIENTSYVEEFVVRIGKKKNQLTLDKKTKLLQNAMVKPWAIRFKGDIFQFSVRFYRYAWYVPTSQWAFRAHVLNFLKDKAATYEETPQEERYETVAWSILSDSFILKKMNFCNRVRLLMSEWIVGFQEIRLNTSKEVFDSEKMLGDLEFDLFLDELGAWRTSTWTTKNNRLETIKWWDDDYGGGPYSCTRTLNMIALLNF